MIAQPQVARTQMAHSQITQPQIDAQLRRLAVALETSVEDLLLHAPAAWASN